MLAIPQSSAPQERRAIAFMVRRISGAICFFPHFDMGMDPLLHDGYPFVYINGEKWFYGQEPEDGIWVVSHHNYGKWYYSFKTEQELIDFLDHLPESREQPKLPHSFFDAPLSQIRWMLSDRGFKELMSEHNTMLQRRLEDRQKNGTAFRYQKAKKP